MPARTERGAAAVYAIAVVALVIAMFLAGMGTQRPLSPRELSVFAAVALAAIAALATEFRRDDHDAAMFCVAGAFVGFLVLGAVVLFGRQPHPVAAAATAACAMTFVLSLVHVVRVERSTDPVPDVLGDRFKSHTAETDDVQWTAVEPAGVASAAAPVAVEVWLQNTRDEPRDVKVHVEHGPWLSGPVSPPVRLGPLEVGVVVLPIAAEPDASGSHDARVWIEASGDGRRVRRRRKTSASRAPSPTFRVLGALAALHNPLELVHLFRENYGVKLRIRTVAAPGARAPRGVATWRSLWRVEGTRWALARRARLGR